MRMKDWCCKQMVKIYKHRSHHDKISLVASLPHKQEGEKHRYQQMHTVMNKESAHLNVSFFKVNKKKREMILIIIILVFKVIVFSD